MTCKKHLGFVDDTLRYSSEINQRGEKCAGGERVGLSLTSNGNHIKHRGASVLNPHTTFHVAGAERLKIPSL